MTASARGHATPPLLVSVLNDLVQVCHDGMKGYARAAEDTSGPELKELFLRLALERASYGRQLREEIRCAGAEISATDGRPIATAHRGWMDARSMVAGRGRDIALLEECERGEGAALHQYERTFHPALWEASASMRTLIQAQYSGVLAARETLRRRIFENHRPPP